MQRNKPRRYKLFFDPDFVIDSANYEHAAEPTEFISRLTENIRVNGLLNPLFVTRYSDDHMVIHPGKCRAKALKSLGRSTAPAVVWTPDGRILPELEQITPECAAGLFSGDVVVEYCHRFFAVKKRRR